MRRDEGMKHFFFLKKDLKKVLNIQDPLDKIIYQFAQNGDLNIGILSIKPSTETHEDQYSNTTLPPNINHNV
jgi:hypothetical protein